MGHSDHCIGYRENMEKAAHKPITVVSERNPEALCVVESPIINLIMPGPAVNNVKELLPQARAEKTLKEC